jgi:sterol desaturase/sphingolipid hydroxylase (fatty acid hydroxylase superfamily)
VSNIETETTIQGPLSDALVRLGSLAQDTFMVEVPADLRWNALLLMFVIAMILFFIRSGHGSRGADGHERKSGLLAFLLPKDIYTHVSARVDIWLWLFEQLFRPLWVASLLVTVGPGTETLVISALEQVFGATSGLQVNLPWMLFYSLVTLLCYDFVFFIIHYSMHRIPFLWALHKVHHSAEVLTPLTRYREHFLVGPLWAAGAALAYGFAAGVFGYLFNGNITEATVLNIGFFALLFGFNGSFRHYHVQFNYPRWLCRWLHSPAMHHVHHSYLPQHWDKNMAAVTSIWDRLFGTLYIPEVDEYTPWGLGPEAQREQRTFWQNATGPFRDWSAMLQRRRASTGNADTPGR